MPIAEVSRPPVPQEAFERFPGRWVALRNGEVVADADTEDELRADNRVESTDTYFLVPQADAHFYSLRPA
jgi:Family of unknown function (DUF5678)